MTRQQRNDLLNYEVQGNGPAVVIIHGLFGDLDNLKNLARSLSSDYTTVVVDVRNHGDSFHSDTMEYPSMATDVLAVIDHLELDQVAVVGHSMGGKIAMELCLTQPERVACAVFADIAPVAYDARHDHILKALTAIDTSTLTSRKDADTELAKNIDTLGVRQFLLKNLRKTGDTYDWRLNLSGITQAYSAITGAVSDGKYGGPVLFIKGGDSDYLLTEHRPTINQLFPQAEAKLIEGTGHWLHAEKPQIFNRLVGTFLDTHFGGNS